MNDDQTAQVEERLFDMLNNPDIPEDDADQLAHELAPLIAASWRAVASVAYPSCGCEPCKKTVEHLAAAGLPKLRGET